MIQRGFQNFAFAFFVERVHDVAVGVSHITDKVRRRVIDAVTDPGPVALLTFLDDARILANDFTIQTNSPRMPNLSINSIMRHSPTRLP